MIGKLTPIGKIQFNYNCYEQNKYQLLYNYEIEIKMLELSYRSTRNKAKNTKYSKHLR